MLIKMISTQEEIDKLNEKLKQYQINDKQSDILKNHNKNRTRNTLALIQQLSKHLQDLKQIEIKLKSNEFTKDEINYMNIEQVNQNGVDLFKSIVEHEFEKDQEYLPEKYQKENFEKLIERNYEKEMLIYFKISFNSKLLIILIQINHLIS
ncbi:hypothetical protein pb186bvf_020582 [Paramecium bursaria]